MEPIMSLIKAVDVPKHLADRLKSRRLSGRLGGPVTKPVVPAKKSVAPLPVAAVPAT
jgi:hypothetical protein